MTGLIHEKEFSRKSVPEGRRRADRRLQRCRRTAVPARPSAGRVARIASNGRRPVPGRLVDRDPCRQHGVDQDGRDPAGNGSDTGLLMIAAEELDMDMSQLEFVHAGHER